MISIIWIKDLKIGEMTVTVNLLWLSYLGSEFVGWWLCKPAFHYSHYPIALFPFFQSLFDTVTKFSLKDNEEHRFCLMSLRYRAAPWGTIRKWMWSTVEEGEMKGTNVFAALVQMHVILCPGTVLLHWGARTESICHNTFCCLHIFLWNWLSSTRVCNPAQLCLKVFEPIQTPLQWQGSEANREFCSIK